MKEPRIVRVSVFASASLDEARLAVMDLLVQLNRTFVPRGVEFVLADTPDDVTGEDLAVALYWRDFGNLPQSKFETAYESLKAGGTPAKIYVFFRESTEELDEAMRAFKDSFASKYGHFYCHFEHVDSVRFQLATQCLAYLPNRVGDLISLDDCGKVSLLGEHVADMENLPFAKLNSKRKSLKRQIEAAENEVTNLEAESASEPDDEDLKDSLREARVKRHDLKEELKQYDGFLFSTALFFAKESAKEMDERVQKARELFEQGKVQAANKILDLPEMIERANRNLELFHEYRADCEKDIQAFLTKAEMVMPDEAFSVPERFTQACEAYDNAIKIAQKISYDDEKFARIRSDYGLLLAGFNKFDLAECQFVRALESCRRLASVNPDMWEPNVAILLHNLGQLHKWMSKFSEAERDFRETLSILRKLAGTTSETYEANVGDTLMSLANLHSSMNRIHEAESEYFGAMEIIRHLAETNPVVHQHELADALNDLAIFHMNTQRLNEAEREYCEALAILRRLADSEPGIYDSDIGETLINIAILHNTMDRHADAECEYAEAMSLLHRLAEVNPDVYEAKLATALHNLGLFRSNCDRLQDAELAYGEALTIRRRLATTIPDAYEPYVADTLNNLANLYKHTNRQVEAETGYNEALAIRRRLADRCPEAYSLKVAQTLFNLGVLHADANQVEKAESEYVEALRFCGNLLEANPSTCDCLRAVTLNRLAELHRATNRKGESEREYAEARNILDRLSSSNVSAEKKRRIWPRLCCVICIALLVILTVCLVISSM